MPVMLQSCVNLGIAETPVHFGAVEAIAVLGKYNALYFVSLPSVAEIHFHTLPFQVGDKHVPVAAPAYFGFEYVVKLILRLVWFFQAVALDILLTANHVQAVFQGQFLADTDTAQTLVPVRNGITVVVYAVESNMHVRMNCVELRC